MACTCSRGCRERERVSKGQNARAALLARTAVLPQAALARQVAANSQLALCERQSLSIALGSTCLRHTTARRTTRPRLARTPLARPHAELSLSATHVHALWCAEYCEQFMSSANRFVTKKESRRSKRKRRTWRTVVPLESSHSLAVWSLDAAGAEEYVSDLVRARTRAQAGERAREKGTHR